MIRTYKRIGNRLNWSEDDMSKAMSNVIRGNLSIRAAAGLFKVPFTTLQNKISAQKLNQAIGNDVPLKAVGHPTILSDDEEKDLAERLKCIANRGFGITPLEVKKAAFMYAEKRNLKHPWTNQKAAGADWFTGFMKRHSDLALRKPQGLSRARAEGMNKSVVQQFYELYQNIVIETGVLAAPERVYNVDESGFPLCNKPLKVVAQKGRHEVVKITNVERGENVTAVVCCSAVGTFIPPFIIFKGKRFKDVYKKDLPPASIVEMTDSGYINEDVFLLWLQHFQKHRVQGRCLLILDGHVSHSSLQCVEFCKENDIELLCLPPHTTHALQPLDRAVFKPMKTFYHEAANSHIVNQPDATINKFVFGKIFTEAWNKSATPAYATKGFQCTGLFPYNPNVIPDDKYLPSLHFCEDNSFPNPDNSLAYSSPLKSSTSSPITPSATPITQSSPPRPSTSSNILSTSRSPFSEIIPSPVKKSRKTNQSKRKTGACHLTSDELVEKQQSKKQKQTSSNNDEENVPCGFCALLYFSQESALKGDWIRCQRCKTWYHEVCVGALGRKQFICGKCI